MIKRAFDFLVALAALGLLLPVMLLIALAIKIDSPGSILFKQERMGRGFRRFMILKFRTMVQNAPSLGGPLTAGRDPRITRVGNILRSMKLDELPQLWNVLIGDMSLVGPRPEVQRYVEAFRADYEQILRVRPGITDLASLKYSDEAALLAHFSDPEEDYLRWLLPDKIRLAKEYVRRASFSFDVGLILKTLLKVSRLDRLSESLVRLW
jgi:lipopolysaccharide/colanic/teichoic acid biosynthesis glycosyltransferase